MSATLLLAAYAVAQPTFVSGPIKFDVKPGTVLTYTTTSVSDFDGMGQVFKTTLKQTQKNEVEAGEDGWLRVKTTTTEFNLQTDMPFGETPDSTGLALTTLVSPTRTIKDWKVLENGKLTKDQADILAGTNKAEMESGFEGLTLPEGDLEVGTSWSLEHSPRGAGMGGMRTTTKGKLKTTYKVLEINGTDAGRVVVIEGKTVGGYDMSIETPDGTFDLGVKVDEARKFTVRGSDGVVTKTELTSKQTMTADFGEFSTQTKSTTELAKA